MLEKRVINQLIIYQNGMRIIDVSMSILHMIAVYISVCIYWVMVVSVLVLDDYCISVCF